jgi:hypothetical protein
MARISPRVSKMKMIESPLGSKRKTLSLFYLFVGTGGVSLPRNLSLKEQITIEN